MGNILCKKAPGAQQHPRPLPSGSGPVWYSFGMRGREFGETDVHVQNDCTPNSRLPAYKGLQAAQRFRPQHTFVPACEHPVELIQQSQFVMGQPGLHRKIVGRVVGEKKTVFQF